VLDHLEHGYARLRAGEFGAIADAWERLCATVGQNVRIQVGSRTAAGRAEALDDDGALLLRTAHGHLERIVGGDVTLAKDEAAEAGA
jgi:BirA family transcriptional regulator, biotin operon repressor / biotin---[acetyl-CoA-carboxylase] ligase